MYPAQKSLPAGRQGYTLVELLVVITIVAILSSVAMMVYTSYVTKSHDVRRKRDLKSIAAALEIYYQKNNRFPCTGDYSWPSFPSYSYQPKPWIKDSNYSACGGNSSLPLSESYISSTPKDPGDNNTFINDASLHGYGYWAGNPNKDGINVCPGRGTGQYYVLITRLENKTDSERNELKGYTGCSGSPLFAPTDSRYKTLYILTSQ